MRLGVASICPHIYFDGRWWSYEPFVLEMNIWTDIFDELVIVAPLDEAPPPAFWSPYRKSEKISVIPYRRFRGKGLQQEKTSVFEIPRMISAIVSAAKVTDAFHVRSPGSIGLLSSLIIPLFTQRMCAKYAGQWNGYPGESWKVRLQRAILRSKWWRGPVTVYGQWPDQPSHIVPFFTSVLDGAQMDLARKSAHEKRPGKPIRILFVGRLTESKNVNVLLRAIFKLKNEGIDFRCTIVGDGPERENLKAHISACGLDLCTTLTGALDFDKVINQYEQADVLVLASETEGWPKVIAEGMAFGLVCVGSNRGIVPWMLGEGRGYLVEPGDVDSLANTLKRIASSPHEYMEMSSKAAVWAQQYSTEGLKKALQELLAKSWGKEGQSE